MCVDIRRAAYEVLSMPVQTMRDSTSTAKPPFHVRISENGLQLAKAIFVTKGRGKTNAVVSQVPSHP